MNDFRTDLTQVELGHVLSTFPVRFPTSRGRSPDLEIYDLLRDRRFRHSKYNWNVPSQTALAKLGSSQKMAMERITYHCEGRVTNITKVTLVVCVWGGACYLHTHFSHTQRIAIKRLVSYYSSMMKTPGSFNTPLSFLTHAHTYCAGAQVCVCVCVSIGCVH